jgi:uncharacterized membrane protein
MNLIAITFAQAQVVRESAPAVGWGTLALINAGLAQSKNRSGLNWFLLSLLLGPFATFFIVVLDPPGPKPGL